MSFTQGLSGLSAASQDLEVIGNNVANANTVGFKGSQAQFGDLFAAALSGAGTSQIGIGTKLETVAQQFTQGNISTTNNTLDMAINGPGFFSLNTGFGTAYSRNGQFQLDKNGYIVSSAGYKLQGYAIDPTTQKPMGSPTSLTVPTAVSEAAATGASLGAGAKGIVAGMNLDSRALPPILPANTFDPTNPNTYNNSTSITTYDSKGVAQNTTMYFVKNSTFLPNATTNMQTINGVTTVTVPTPTPSTLTVGQAVQGAGFPTGTTIATIGDQFAASLTSGSNIVTPPITSMGSLVVGQAITGPGIPSGTTIASLTGSVNLAGVGITSGSATVTGLASTAGLVVGQTISGAGIPAGATITAIDSVGNTITMSSAATATNAAANLTAGATGLTLSNNATVTAAGVDMTVDTGTFTTSANPVPVPSATTPADITVDYPNSWKVYTTVTDPTTGAYIFPNPSPTSGNWVSNGTLYFGTNGRFPSAGGFVPNANAPTQAANAGAGVTGPTNTTTSISFTPNGASPETIPFDFSASTQFGTAFGVTTLSQDGFTAGQLSGFSIGSDGMITGKYSNGQTKPLGQVALTTFPNMQGLQPLGNNTWAQSGTSGSPTTNAPGVGNNGTLQTQATEDSNVDLTAELVNMMTAQRNYQANAQTIKTQDTVMQTLINMR
jgi:flagellar hook protein FlgE